MAQLCNVSYALLTRDADAKSVQQLDAELSADPSGGPMSHGVEDLMAAMRMPTK